MTTRFRLFHVWEDGRGEAFVDEYVFNWEDAERGLTPKQVTQNIENMIAKAWQENPPPPGAKFEIREE